MRPKKTDIFPKFDLASLKTKGFPGNTPAQGATMAEAASFCLENNDHSSPCLMTISGSFDSKAEIFWSEVTEQIRRGHNDLRKAAENGAYAVAFFLLEHFRELVPVFQSRQGSGFDYFLGNQKSKTLDDMKFKARLEVSGILKGGSKEINGRVRQKEDQVKVSDDLGFPVYIVVVEFGKPVSKVVERCLNS